MANHFSWLKLKQLVLVMILVGMGRGVSVVSADAYQVNATVPYAAPTQPAVFDPGLDGKTVDAALVTVSGTCEVFNPANTVVIVRDSTNVGSVPCTSGTFSLQIMLNEGDNVLRAKTINATMVEGPESQPITMRLVLPPTVTPTPNTPTPTAPPSTTQEVTEQTNSGAAAELTAAPSEPFSVVKNDSKEVTINVTVGGGTTPYTIVLNWGDGSTETRTVDQPGVYTFTHEYTSVGNYQVRGTVRDVLGATTVFEYAVVSAEKMSPGSDKAADGTSSAGNGEGILDRLSPFMPATAAVTGVAAVLGAGYWFGAHHAAAQLLQGSSQSSPRSNKTRPKAKPRSSKRVTKRRR